jgi:uncharacterized alkaline shock family protein YloU
MSLRPDEDGQYPYIQEVLAVIAAAAATECGRRGRPDRKPGHRPGRAVLGKKNMTKGVHIQVGEDAVTMELAILIKYG